MHLASHGQRSTTVRCLLSTNVPHLRTNVTRFKLAKPLVTTYEVFRFVARYSADISAGIAHPKRLSAEVTGSRKVPFESDNSEGAGWHGSIRVPIAARSWPEDR